MTDIKERILSDAIRIAIKNQVKIYKLQKAIGVLSVIIAILIVGVVVLFCQL